MTDPTTREYTSPEYVNVGDKVIAPWSGTTGVWCTVAVAAGMHARVVNERRGIDRWYRITSLAVCCD